MIDHYEADVQTAQDYYPFGMIMPGRMFTALTVPGGSVTGTTQVNGFTVPVDLALTSRSGNEPTQYVASRTIDLDEGFESGTNDDVTAYLTDTSYAGSGNGGSGADGVAGAGKYAYAFNGKRKDNEIQGEKNTYDYVAREYDPRGVHFWSVDPLTKKYPMLTPYQFASNSPVAGADLDGLEFDLRTTVLRNLQGRVFQMQDNEAAIKKKWQEYSLLSMKREGSLSPAPKASGPYEQQLWQQHSTQKWQDNEYNDDGSKPFLKRLGDNKTWNSFAENLALPLLDGYLTLSGLNEAGAFEKVGSMFKAADGITFDRMESITFAEIKGQPLGWYKNSVEKGLELDLNIPKNLQNKGLGSQIFEDALKSTNADKFTATWIESTDYETGSSVNLQRFIAAEKTGATETEAAWKTWSGQQAKKAGFKNVTITRLNNVLTKGIQATFTK